MASLREIRYDIIMILTKMGYSNDSRLEEDYIDYKIHQYRAKAIRDTYNRNGIVEPAWLQQLGRMPTFEVDYTEERGFVICSVKKLWKVVLPSLVSFSDKRSVENDLGLYSVTNAAGQKYYPIGLDKFMLMAEGSVRANFSYMIRFGNSLYITKDVKNIYPVVVLENPLDGFLIQNGPQLELIIGERYIVTDGQVLSDGKVYQKDQDFVATSTILTGLGKVEFYYGKRKFTELDNYPMSLTMMEEVILNLLSKEFNIEKQQVADAIQDSRDSS